MHRRPVSRRRRSSGVRRRTRGTSSTTNATRVGSSLAPALDRSPRENGCYLASPRRPRLPLSRWRVIAMTHRSSPGVVGSISLVGPSRNLLAEVSYVSTRPMTPPDLSPSMRSMTRASSRRPLTGRTTSTSRTPSSHRATPVLSCVRGAHQARCQRTVSDVPSLTRTPRPSPLEFASVEDATVALHDEVVHVMELTRTPSTPPSSWRHPAAGDGSSASSDGPRHPAATGR